jgi:hypothetical protein
MTSTSSAARSMPKRQGEQRHARSLCLTAGCQAMARTTPGEKYRAPDGSWQTRTARPRHSAIPAAGEAVRPPRAPQMRRQSAAEWQRARLSQLLTAGDVAPLLRGRRPRRAPCCACLVLPLDGAWHERRETRPRTHSLEDARIDALEARLKAAREREEQRNRPRCRGPMRITAAATACWQIFWAGSSAVW